MASETDTVRANFALDIGQTTELIAQLLANTPGGKLGSDDIGEAIATVADLYTAAATLELWRSERIVFGWDKDERELVLCSTELDSEADQVGRLILRGNDDG